MEWPDGRPIDVPRSEQRLEGLHESVAGVTPQRLAELVRLDDGRQVGQEDAAGAEHPGHGIDETPGLGQVEDSAVDLLLVGDAFLDRLKTHAQARDLAHAELDVRDRATAEVVAS